MTKSSVKSRRGLLAAGVLGVAGAGVAKAQAGESWKPKKQIIGLKPGQSTKGMLLSGCIRSGHLLFFAGIGGWYPERRKEPGDVKVQIRSALESLQTRLAQAGSSMSNVLKITIALSDMPSNFAPMNEVYKEFFPEEPPVRSVFPASTYHRKEQLLQMDAIAYVD